MIVSGHDIPLLISILDTNPAPSQLSAQSISTVEAMAEMQETVISGGIGVVNTGSTISHTVIICCC
jgi:hypothetical protein